MKKLNFSRYPGEACPGCLNPGTGVQSVRKALKTLDSGACPGPDPGFAGMTERRTKLIFHTSVEGHGEGDNKLIV